VSVAALKALDEAEDAITRARLALAVAPAPPQPAPALAFRAATFFDAVRTKPPLGPGLSEGEVKGCETLLEVLHGWPVSWVANALAQVWVETAGTMEPIEERGSVAYFIRRYDIRGERPDKARELGNTIPGDGARFCGRGYVQITGKANYARAGGKLGLPLVDEPDRALDPPTAAAILRRGCEEGWFTGKSLRHYLPDGLGTSAQHKAARKVVNGQDRADEIAGYAMTFQTALQAGGWS
jgi:putative chitinase